jgi:hypothetical protein
MVCGRTTEDVEQGRNSEKASVVCFQAELWNVSGVTERNQEHFSHCLHRLGAHIQFSVVQLFDRPIICYAHTVQLNDRSTVKSAHMQLNSCCNNKLC